MKTNVTAALALAATFFTAGYLVGDGSARHAIASAVASDSLAMETHAHPESGSSDEWAHPALPEGHPPVLPEGHPLVLPEGHPPLPNRGASCPYSDGEEGLNRAFGIKADARKPVSI
jgi:hypothetical protein